MTVKRVTRRMACTPPPLDEWPTIRSARNPAAYGHFDIGLLRELWKASVRLSSLAHKCGLVNLVGSLSFLWAEIDLAEGKKTSAATWLMKARNRFAEDDVENATRLLDILEAEE